MEESANIDFGGQNSSRNRIDPNDPNDIDR